MGQLAKTLKTTQDEHISSSSGPPKLVSRKNEMDIDQVKYCQLVSDQWVWFMKQAENSISVVADMFDEQRQIKDYVDGLIMTLSIDKQGWNPERRSR